MEAPVSIMKGKEFVDPRKVKLMWQEAMYEASLQKGHLRIAWNVLPYIDSALYTFEKTFQTTLVSLRLIGVQLETFPREIGEHLFQIELISFENNRIVEVPDSLINCSLLRELCLANNVIRHLPERIGYLCNLQLLTLNNNRLETLPLTFGGLNLLTRIDLECNELKVLPENFNNLTNCQVLNLNRNKLVRLPGSIGHMPSLTQLSASWNQLTQLPSELCSSKSLSIIRIAMNKLRRLPDKLGELGHTLTELTVEYNQLRMLPISFHKLRHLQVFRVEGNESVVDPPPEVLLRGAQEVVQYCIRQYFNDKEARMRHIIMALQSVLHQIADRGIFDLGLFEPHVHMPNGDDDGRQDPDGWFALQMPYYWRVLLPKMQEIWHAQQVATALTEMGSFFTGGNNSLTGGAQDDQVTDFDFSEREVMWALTHYSDAMGPVLRRQPANFRRCGCADPATGAPKPCVPPKLGFMCRRTAIWVKRKIVRQRDAADRKWVAYKMEQETDAVRRAELEAEQYLQSAAGKRWLDETACEQAEDLLMEQTADIIVQQRIAKTETKKAKVIKEFNVKMARIQRLRDGKLRTLQKEVDELKEEQRRTREGYLRNVLEDKLEDLAQQMATLPEIQQLENLQEQCQQAVEALEDELYREVDDSDDEDKKKKKKGKKGNDGDDEDEEGGRRKRESSGESDEDSTARAERKKLEEEEDDMLATLDTDELREMVDRDRKDLANHEEEFDSDDSSPEARQFRRMRRKRILRLQRLEQQQELREEEFEQISTQLRHLQDQQFAPSHGNQEYLGRQRMALDIFLLQSSHRMRTLMHKFEQSRTYDDVYKPMRRYLRRQRYMAKKQMRNVLETSKMRVGKFMRRMNGDFNELCRELTYEIRRQYVHHTMETARRSMQHEFSVIERVRMKMAGTSVEISFIAWKKYVWTKQQRERQDLRRQYKRAVKHYETSMESVRSAEIQVEMWQPQRDIYSDRAYWQHGRTADITYDQPTVYHYLPWNFVIPELPDELPSDISLNTTDESEYEIELNSRPATGHSAANGAGGGGGANSKEVRAAISDAVKQAAEDQAASKQQQKKLGTSKVVDSAQQQGAEVSRRSVQQDLLQWQAKYGKRRRLVQENEDSRRELRRERRRRVHRTASELMAAGTGELVQHMEPFEAQDPSVWADGGSVGALYPPTNSNTTVTSASTAHHPQHNRTMTPLEQTLQQVRAHRAHSQQLQRTMSNNDTFQAFDPSQLVLPLSARVKESASHVAVTSTQEYELAYKAIRRKRNQLNPNRHHLYMSHVNRKPKSMEQHRTDQAEEDAKHMLEVEPGVFVDDRKIDLVHPSEEELLRLAGGNLDMVYTGKAGLELRTVLAQRALHIKETLHAQAIEKGIISRAKDHNTIYNKEIKPFFMHRYEGSSSEDSDDEEEEAQGRKPRGVFSALFGGGSSGPKRESTGKRAKKRAIHKRQKEERRKERDLHARMGADVDKEK